MIHCLCAFVKAFWQHCCVPIIEQFTGIMIYWQYQIWTNILWMDHNSLLWYISTARYNGHNLLQIMFSNTMPSESDWYAYDISRYICRTMHAKDNAKFQANSSISFGIMGQKTSFSGHFEPTGGTTWCLNCNQYVPILT